MKCVCGQGDGKTEMENYIEYGYVGLAVISFLAATILPVGSEVFFMAMIAAGYPAGWCLWWAFGQNRVAGEAFKVQCGKNGGGAGAAAL